MNKLNEHLFSKSYWNEDHAEEDFEMVVDPTYADALRGRKKDKKALDDTFKEQDKATDDFVKANHETENKPKGTKEMKKMKLSESLFEGTATETDDLYYKAKRESVADVIMMTLTSGETAYRMGANGKLIPTTAPSLNLDEYDVGPNEEGDGRQYIIANVPDEGTQAKVEELAKRFGKDFVSGSHSSGWKTPFYTKIYIDESDWDTPYVDPNAKTRKDARKSA